MKIQRNYEFMKKLKHYYILCHIPTFLKEQVLLGAKGGRTEERADKVIL